MFLPGNEVDASIEAISSLKEEMSLKKWVIFGMDLSEEIMRPILEFIELQA